MTAVLNMHSSPSELELRIRQLERLLERKATEIEIVKDELDAARASLAGPRAKTVHR
jgi:hypothetical protein